MRFRQCITALISCLSLFSVNLAAKPGTLLWQYPTGAPIWAPIVVDQHIAYVANDNGRLLALDLEKRQPRWQVNVQQKIRSAAAVNNQRILFSSDDGFLYALDKQQGKILWQTKIADRSSKRVLPGPNPPWEYDWNASSPVIVNDTVYIGSVDHQLYAVDLTDGKVRWTFTAGNGIRSTPLVVGERLYFGCWDNSVYALNRSTGGLVWRFDTEGRIVSDATFVDGKIIIGSRSARLFALDADTGKVIWKYTYGDGSWVESSASAGPEGLFIGSSDARKLSRFDPDSGKEIWSFATLGWSWFRPTVANGVVYIGAMGSTQYWQAVKRGFYAVDAKSGQLRWQYEPDRQAGFIDGGATAAAVTKGWVVVGDLDGHVKIFEE